MLKFINFWLSSLIGQKLYWNLAGKIHPWQAVLEDAPSLDSVYKRSKDIVDILEKLKLINKNSVVLDIGCGVGRGEYTLAKKVKECIGVDISSSMIKIARKYVKNNNVKFYITNGHDLKILSNKKFDLIFSILVFQHMPKEPFINYLKESFIILKNKGMICFQISIYQKDKPKDPPKSHPWALRFYNLVELEKILKKIGFVDIKFYDATGKKLNVNLSQAFVVAQKL